MVEVRRADEPEPICSGLADVSAPLTVSFVSGGDLQDDGVRHQLPLVLTALVLCACQEAPAPRGAVQQAHRTDTQPERSSYAPAAVQADEASPPEEQKQASQPGSSSVEATPPASQGDAHLAREGALHTAAVTPSSAASSREAPRTPAGAQSDLVRLRASALAAVPGEVLEVEIDEDDVPVTYEFKILTPQGRVIELELDARSGRILEQEAE